MKILLRKADYGHTNLFEWSPKGSRWYPINIKNVRFTHNGSSEPKEALATYRAAMNQMLTYPGFWIATFKGVYNRQTGELTLKCSGD